MKAVFLASLVALSLVSSGQASQPAAPVLSTESKLQLQNGVQRLQILQLQAQAAQRDLTDLIASLQKDGFDLDLATLSYRPKPSEKR